MPNKANHLSTAIENQRVACKLLDGDPSLAWATTIAFYSALHLVEALFATEDRHFDSHPSRNQHLKNTRNLQSIWLHYKQLYDYSLKARYLTSEDASAEALMQSYLGAANVRDRILNHHLRQIEKSVAKRMDVERIFG